ncbi:hypothetical protein [Thalassotalea aquiviva]|uniref:hypothetical protein n=1 Tax=Thalassotalea aquiviva TaxID=3242415 RepID=UPI00352A760C
MQAKLSPPKWFYVVTILAIVWNLLGVMAFLTGPLINQDAITGLQEAERQFYLQMPLWAKIAFAGAVFSGTLGALLLTMRKPIASVLLQLSLGCVLVQMFHAYALANSWQLFGLSGAVMPTLVILVAIYLVLLAQKAKAWSV